MENLEIVVPYVATAANIADFLTKPLNAKQFAAHRAKIMGVPWLP